MFILECLLQITSLRGVFASQPLNNRLGIGNEHFLVTIALTALFTQTIGI